MILVDGNGILHPSRFGLACHIGVMADVPTVGVAKNLFQVSSILIGTVGLDNPQHITIFTCSASAGHEQMDFSSSLYKFLK